MHFEFLKNFFKVKCGDILNEKFYTSDYFY